MKCLDDVVIQAVVDGEAAEAESAHAAQCHACAARVAERRSRTAAMAAALDLDGRLPPRIEARIGALLESPARGATRLRPTAQTSWRRGLWGGVAVAAATLVAVVLIAPLFRGPTTVSAAEILARSASRLAQAVSGVEQLEYELVLDGMPRDMMPDHADGAYRVSQTIDHGAPGRFRYSTFSPDGRLLTSIAQDPAAKRRTSLIRIDDRFYRFELAMQPGLPSLPDIERLHMQATVAMMQASGQQLMAPVETAGGPGYRIQVPRVAGETASAVWDLNEAQVVIGAGDFRITELTASGTFLKQPYSLSYRLLAHTMAPAVEPSVFAVPHESGEIVVAGDGTANPARDVLVGALRALAQARDGR